ncbi:hypothetical protein ACP4OV_028420 [Aristida adscensionis]
MAAKLAVVMALALLFSVSCVAGDGDGNPAPTPPPPPSYPAAASPSSPPADGLRVGFYDDDKGRKCPGAEDIVRDVVRAADAGVKAGLIRLFFHDCFVRGCDGSVLLNTTSHPQPEMAGAPNLSLRGFEVIDAAKAALERRCPGKVSCADVVAFAARDASYFLSGREVSFKMPAGRYDGLVSLASETLPNLPPPFAGVERLKDMFAAKGLAADDMVALAGAHSVGRSHCSSFRDRLPPNASDMNATLAAELSQQCGGGGDPTVMQDVRTPNVLDNQYYSNVLDNDVLFESDAALGSTETSDLVSCYARSPAEWRRRFAEAMVKMGRVEVKTSANGEIRKECGVVNKPYSA